MGILGNKRVHLLGQLSASQCLLNFDALLIRHLLPHGLLALKRVAFLLVEVLSRLSLSLLEHMLGVQL